MTDSEKEAFNVGLNRDDQRELQKMIDAVRQNRPEKPAPGEMSRDPLQRQLDDVMRRVADLTEMVLKLEGQITPLVTILELTQEKSERLNQRLNAVISALKESRHKM